MPDELRQTCGDCQGPMSPIVVMDKLGRAYPSSLEYRQPDDRLSFWTGKYPTAGPVNAFMCQACGRIALYGGKHDETG